MLRRERVSRSQQGKHAVMSRESCLFALTVLVSLHSLVCASGRQPEKPPVLPSR